MHIHPCTYTHTPMHTPMHTRTMNTMLLLVGRREVVRVFTPGTLLPEIDVEDDSPRHLAVVIPNQPYNPCGFSSLRLTACIVCLWFSARIIAATTTAITSQVLVSSLASSHTTCLFCSPHPPLPPFPRFQTVAAALLMPLPPPARGMACVFTTTSRDKCRHPPTTPVICWRRCQRLISWRCCLCCPTSVRFGARDKRRGAGCGTKQGEKREEGEGAREGREGLYGARELPKQPTCFCS